MKKEITVNDVESALCKINYGYSLWANKKGLDPFRLDIYDALLHMDNPTQKMIGEKYYLPKQTVNNVINDLAREKKISFMPNPKDKREKIILLTDKGRSYLEECILPGDSLNKNILKTLGKEKVEQLYTLLNQYGEKLHQEVKETK